MILLKENEPITKNLKEQIKQLFDNFVIELNNGTLHPVDLIKKYKPYFEEIDSTFKKFILNNEKARTGMFIKQCDGYRIQDYLLNEFKFARTRSNLFMSYTQDKLYQLTLFEISLLYRKHKFLYKFMIRYALYMVLTGYFRIYDKDESIKDWKLAFDTETLESVYQRLIKTDEHDLPDFDTDLDIAVIKNVDKIRESKKVNVPGLSKPTKPEDITSLFEGREDKDELTQTEKYKIAAEYWHCSVRTMQTYFSRFGLCKNKNNAKEKPIKEEIKINDDIMDRLRDLETRLAAKEKENELLNQTVQLLSAQVTQYDKIIDGLKKDKEELKEEVESLKKRNEKIDIFTSGLKDDDSFSLDSGNLKFQIRKNNN